MEINCINWAAYFENCIFKLKISTVPVFYKIGSWIHVFCKQFEERHYKKMWKYFILLENRFLKISFPILKIKITSLLDVKMLKVWIHVSTWTEIDWKMLSLEKKYFVNAYRKRRLKMIFYSFLNDNLYYFF